MMPSNIEAIIRAFDVMYQALKSIVSYGHAAGCDEIDIPPQLCRCNTAAQREIAKDAIQQVKDLLEGNPKGTAK
jgi:hypothetical protein